MDVVLIIVGENVKVPRCSLATLAHQLSVPIGFFPELFGLCSSTPKSRKHSLFTGSFCQKRTPFSNRSRAAVFSAGNSKARDLLANDVIFGPHSHPYLTSQKAPGSDASVRNRSCAEWQGQHMAGQDLLAC